MEASGGVGVCVCVYAVIFEAVDMLGTVHLHKPVESFLAPR